MKRGIALLFLGLLFTGCQQKPAPEPTQKPLSAQEQKEEQAIETVQKAESSADGVNINDCLSSVLRQSQDRGRRVEVQGWGAVINKDGPADVYFKVVEENAPLDFHWKVLGQKVMPVNRLTETVTKKQVLQL